MPKAKRKKRSTATAPLTLDDPEKCVPFVIGCGASDIGPRFGGMPPEGVRPKKVLDRMEYLLTIPLLDGSGQELSLFLALPYEFVWDNQSKLLPCEREVQVVVHSASRRAKSSKLRSKFEPLPLVLRRKRSDVTTDDDGEPMPLPEHKLGGFPCLVAPSRRLASGLVKLVEAGATQLLQLDFPSASDPGLMKIDGNWPFGMGMFHLLRTPKGWQCFWANI